jgi:vacuolar-type H+-ATPase subunit I/STV1
MFDNLRNAFKEAIDNFNKELDRDQVPGAVDRLLAGMRDEVADAKVRIRELEDQITRADAEAAREKAEASTARRRGKLAAGIDDAETVQLAEQYAVRHEERQRILEQKSAALRQELVIRQKEVEEMLAKVKEAQAKRDTLAATSGRSGARESLGAADDLFSELDRMAEAIGDEDARAKAAEDFADLDLDADPDLPPPPLPVDFDARLEELKRRMGKD